MKLNEITSFLELSAPRSNQDSWDNSGLQLGCSDKDIHKAVVCLDVTEEVVDEAVRIGADLIVSHHPLIFKGVKSIADKSYQERCIRKAILSDIAIYSAHTSLDNSVGGVNHEIARRLSLTDLQWLDSGLDASEGHGSGLFGVLAEPMEATEFLHKVKSVFGVTALKHSGAEEGKKLSRVALCGGSGAFLLPRAVEMGADCFLSGEFHYHDYFDPGTLLIELGHYESEQYTQDLICRRLAEGFPELETSCTSVLTNPAKWIL